MTSDELRAIITELRTFETDLQHVEAKAASGGLPERLWKTLSAFANTPGGGTLILGLEESSGFTTVGATNPPKAMQDIASLCDQMVPPIRPLIDLHEIENTTLVVAEIPETPLDQKPCFYSGAGLTNGAFIRVADGDRRLTQYEVQVMQASRGQPREDLEPVPGTTPDDLHPELTDAFLQRLKDARPAVRSSDDEEILQMVGVLVEHEGVVVVTLGGLLALGRDPQSHFPELGLTFVAYPGTRIGEEGPAGERFLDEARVEGPIPLMIKPVMTTLQRNMKRRAIIQGVGRDSQWEYPLPALREAIVNALVHRDFSALARGTPVQVQLFTDRLTIINPGGLHGPVTIETLGEAGVSSSRNATLMRILEDTPIPEEQLLVCENRGSGIGAMLTALRDVGMSPPEFRDAIATFSVTFPNHTLFDHQTLAWLGEIGADELSDNQRVGLALLRNGQTLSNEVYRRFNNVDSRVATRELRELVQRGLVRSVSSGRWTTYRLTVKVREQQELLIDVRAGRSTEIKSPLSRQIVELLKAHESLSRAEIAETLSTPDGTVRYRLKKLRDQGVIEMTESPRSPNQRYRLAKA